MIIFEKYSRDLANWSLFFFSFSLGSFPIIASSALIVFSVFSFSHGYFKRDGLHRKKLMIFAPIFGLFLIYVLGLIYSPNISYGVKFIVRSISLILVPLALWYRGGIDSTTYRRALKGFIIGLTVSCVISLLIAFIHFLNTRSLNEFTYYELADTIGLHPTYYSLFILTAFVFLNQLHKVKKTYKVLFVLLGVMVIILLQSRIALLGLCVVGVYSFMTVQSRNYRWALSISSIILLTTIFLSQNFTDRIKDVINFEPTSENIGTFKENGINQRAWLWKNAFHQIKEKPLFGFGLGAQRNIFKWKIEKDLLGREFDNELILAEKKIADMNLHNQYLQIWYECGLLGLSLFLIALYNISYRSLKRKCYSQTVILILFSIFLITESMLIRQMGILFYSLIFSLLLASQEEEK